ncbi:MAG: DUF4292 domain-containing protein [Bacteroidota bacterium]
MSRNSGAVIIIVLFLLNGCAAHKESVKNLNLSLPEVLAKVRERNSFIKTLKGGGAITVEAPKVSNNGSFDVDLKKPDSMLVEFHGPFGLHVGTLSLDRDQFIFYNRMENTAVIGKPDGRTLEAMFHLDMEFNEILHAFTGEFPLSVENDSLVRFYVEKDSYTAIFKDEQGTKEYHIDAGDFIINSYRTLDSTGEVVMNASASRPTSVENFEMPTLLRVIFPKERRSITIYYHDIHLNEPVECYFTLPDNVDHIYR